MSSCSYTRKDILVTTKNIVEDAFENYGKVKHSGHTTTINLRDNTQEEREQSYEQMKAWLVQKNQTFNDMRLDGKAFDFMTISANEDFTQVTVDYKSMEMLKDTVNEFHDMQRDFANPKKLTRAQKKVLKSWKGYQEAVKSYEEMMAKGNKEEIRQARTETMQQAKEFISNNGYNSNKNNTSDKKKDVKKKGMSLGLKPDFEIGDVPNFDGIDINDYAKVINGFNQYADSVKDVMKDLSKEIKRLEKVKNKTAEDHVSLDKAKEYHAKMKLLFFNNEKAIKGMEANEYMEALIKEMDMLKEGVDDARKNNNYNNIRTMYNRMNFIKALLYGEGFDGSTIRNNFAPLNNEALSYLRDGYNALERDFNEIAKDYVIDNLMSNKLFTDNLSAMGIKDIKQGMRLMIAKGDLNWFEQKLTGISFSNKDVGFLPEMIKVLFHDKHAKYIAEGNKLKERLREVDAKVGKDKSFALERGLNGKLTGRLNYWFKSEWVNLLNSLGSGEERVKGYEEHAIRVNYRLIPELHSQFKNLDPTKYNNSEEDMEFYKRHLMDKLGENVYYRLVKRSREKLEEYYTMRELGDDVSKFDPYGEHRGEEDTYYMEFIPKEDKYYNRAYLDATAEQQEYIDTIIAINKSFVQVYIDDYNSLSFGKFNLGLLGSIKNEKDLKGKTGEVMSSLLNLMYRNKDAFISNKVHVKYVDNFEAFKKKLFKHLSSMTDKELFQYAQDVGLDLPADVTERSVIMDNIATQVYNVDYSTDITKATERMIDIAGEAAARTEMLPIGQEMFRLFKLHNFDKRGVQSTMKNYIDTILKGGTPEDLELFKTVLSRKIKPEDINSLSDVASIALTGKRISKNDKVLVDLIRSNAEKDIYKDEITFTDANGNEYKNNPAAGTFFMNSKKVSADEFEIEFARSLAAKLNETGLPLTIGSVFRGFNTVVLFKYLGVSPFAGQINRWQGMIDNGMADVTGHYWTPGNLNNSQKFLTGANTLNYLNDIEQGIKPNSVTNLMKQVIPEGKRKELAKMDMFVKSLGLGLGERGNLLVRWSIGDPEHKNSMEVLLSIMQDFKIKDVNGNEHQLFNGKELVPFDIVDGKLRLKDEFRNDDNVDMYENFLKGKDGSQPAAELVTKYNKALSHIHNNFDKHDVTTSYNNVLMSTMAMLKRWIISGVMQRFSSGQGRDYTFNKKKKEGRWITGIKHPTSGISFAAGNILVAAGLGTGGTILGSMGVAAGAIYFGYKYYMKKVHKQNIKTAAFNVQELAIFWRSALLSAIDFPVRIFGGRGFAKYGSNFVKGGKLTAEEVGNIKALGMELGTAASFLMLSLGALSLLRGDDDDDEALADKHFYNYVANRLSALVYANHLYMNPAEFIKTLGNVGIVQYTGDLINLTKTILSREDVTDEKMNKLLSKASPLPGTITNSIFHGNPFWSEKEITGTPFKTFFETDEDVAKKKASVIRKNFTDNLKKQGYTNDKQIRRIKNMYVPNKNKYESYSSNLAKLQERTADINYDAIRSTYEPY